MTPNAVKLHRASAFLLNLSRGTVPRCPVSPYGGLDTDWRAIQDEARNAYEILRKLEPKAEYKDFSSTG